MKKQSGAVLTAAWFERCPVAAARELLGARLCRRDDAGNVTRWLVSETEAYNGTADLACHASKGLTPRTVVLFGPPGHWYVYLCYGIHWMLNIVTREEGFPAAVLVRGVVSAREPARILDGPGKLTKALGIGKSLNAVVARPECGLWLESSPPAPPGEIVAGPRIGVDYAGPEWAARPWRFVWKRACR